MAPVEIAALPHDRYGEASELYAQCGYRHGLADRDYVLAATQQGALIGVARLCREHDTTVLRGMQVLPGFQRRGVGTRLLEACVAALGDSACYCLPWAYLEPFFARFDFRPCAPGAAPQFLLDRHATYHAEGYDVLLMRRGEE